MILSKKDLKFYIAEDAKRNGVSTNPIVCYVLAFTGREKYHIFRYLRCLRKCEYHLNNNHKIRYAFYLIKLSRLGLRYNIRIPINVCGYGLKIVHCAGGGGVLLNAEKIGNYCGFNAGVLLGNKDLIENKPIIGDYVSFAPGSKAIGKVIIGSNVLVAPNAVVIQDIPNNVTVGGIPAKIISEQGPWDLEKGVPKSEERRASEDNILNDNMSLLAMLKTLLKNESKK